ncbi:MAG: O-antigen ligase family protein [Tolypothrix carrinoi HA7290-LM1]|jgi:O-antigen ligase|nr:O-antigen ligase family protein [Tolypothrix carrinoi HA7290-LM1]
MKRKYLELAEQIFVIISLTFFTRGFDVGRNGDAPGLLPVVFVTAIRYSVWAISAFLICVRWKKALVAITRDVFILMLVLIILTSYVWSEYPDFTLKNMQEIWQMLTFGLYFATSYSVKQQLKLVATTLALGVIFSIFVVFRYPTIGKHIYDHPGVWKGIYDYKNTFGSMMVLSSLAFYLLKCENQKQRLYKWGLFLLSISMIPLSNSKTSLIISLIIIFILYFYRNYRWRGKISLVYLDIGILILGSISTIVLTFWVSILSGLGKDVTLTGRLPMWHFIFTQLEERPWLGFGRGAFWAKGSKFAIAAGQAVSEGYLPPHAHNGYIDLILDSGLIGLSLFIISFILVYNRALKFAYGSKNPEDYWPLAVLLFLTLNNMMESYFSRLANIYFVMYITTALSAMPKKPHKKLNSG